ncbi:MAG TPA: SBBP repeat-containing protein [Phycisphaerae bacterium]|nr:SBBP repeat-containing protein [Phycisphaerae bacterium]
MKKSVVLSFLIISANYVHAQVDVKAWTRLAGTVTLDEGYAAAADPSGNCIIAGATQGSLGGSNAGRYDMFVGKYDATGNRLWLTQRGTIERDFAFGVATDASGNIYVTGYTGAALDGQAHMGKWDIFLMKFGPTGNWLWTRQIGTGQDDEGRAVATDSSGNVYITGYVRGDLHGQTRVGLADVFICKYNSAGTRLWTRLFGSAEIDESLGIACDAAGSVFVTGWCAGSIEGNPYLGNGDNYLVKYDTNGQRLWLRQWGTANKDTGYSLATDAAGNVYLSGYTTGQLYGPQLGERDVFLVKFDASGNPLWARQFGTAGHDQGWGVATDDDGNAYAAGETGGALHENVHQGGLDIFLTKYDPTGTRLWTTQVGTAGNDWARGAATATDGITFLAGTTGDNLDGNPNQGGTDAFAMKFAPAPNEPPAEPTDALANPATICSGSSSQLSATPGSSGDTVEWFTVSCGGTAVPGGASPTVSPSVTTNYYARTKNSATGSTSSTCATVTVTVNTPTPADLDRDCDVDQSDFNLFAACISGPTVPLSTGCESSDFDDDNDVDQSDFGIFQCCYSGAGIPADPNCANSP